MVVQSARARGVSRRRFCTLLVATAVGAAFGPALAEQAALRQKTFETPAAAAGGLAKAYEKGEKQAIAEILGDEGYRLVSSGDQVIDRLEREWFLSLYRERHRIEADGKTMATLLLGAREQPYPIPIVKTGGRWRFDKVEGHEDLLSRRMSKNELSALDFVVAVAQAQKEYHAKSVERTGARQYASRIVSSEGRHDGLVWKDKDGGAAGPLAGLAEEARREGYRRAADGGDETYRGYHYRILTAQGANAPGGARDYRVDGRLTGGFALIAYPARYGVSGIMTFLVTGDGIVFQKDLGPETVAIARRTTAFNPDDSWTKGK